MATLHDDVFDNGLNVLPTNVENLYVCSQEPTTFTEASSTYKLGTKSAPSIGSPADKAGGGREVTVAAISDGTVDATGTASHYALTDNSATKLLATGSLAASQSVTAGNPFTLAAFAVGIPDPV